MKSWVFFGGVELPWSSLVLISSAQKAKTNSSKYGRNHSTARAIQRTHSRYVKCVQGSGLVSNCGFILGLRASKDWIFDDFRFWTCWDGLGFFYFISCTGYGFIFYFQTMCKMTNLFIIKSGTYFISKRETWKMKSANKWGFLRNICDSNITPEL